MSSVEGHVGPVCEVSVTCEVYVPFFPVVRVTAWVEVCEILVTEVPSGCMCEVSSVYDGSSA